MSFTYDFTTAPDISRVRRMISDTDATQPVYQDDEINDALQMFSSQNVIIGLTGFAPAVPVVQVYSHRRAAADLISGIAANKGRLGLVQQILDVKIDAAKIADALRAIAADLIKREENDGFFAVSEMVQDPFSMRERLWKMLYRQGT
jgi:hypothetical protein